LPEPRVTEVTTGGRKRKMVSSVSAAAKLIPSKEHLYGRLNPKDLGSILHNSISAENFLAKFSEKLHP
jgi:hypothetical protein